MVNIKYSVLIFTLLTYGAVFANDLDGDIPIDDPIDDSLQKDINTEFIVTKSTNRAIAREKRGEDSKTIILDESNSSGVGNIDIGAGSDLKGATIINLSNNKDSAVISD